MRDAREAVELDIVLARMAAQYAQDAFAQLQRVFEFGSKLIHRRVGKIEQALHLLIELLFGVACIFGSHAARFNGGQAMAQGADQGFTPLAVGEQVVFQIRVAHEHPDIAEHFVQHLRRASGAALFAQGVDDVPCFAAQDAQHDLAIGEGRVVVGYFA